MEESTLKINNIDFLALIQNLKFLILYYWGRLALKRASELCSLINSPRKCRGIDKAPHPISKISRLRIRNLKLL